MIRALFVALALLAAACGTPPADPCTPEPVSHECHDHADGTRSCAYVLTAVPAGCDNASPAAHLLER